MEEETHMLTTWAIIAGKWEVKDNSVIYQGPDDPNSPTPYGIALSEGRARSGSIQTKVHFFKKPKNSAGRIVFGYNPEIGEYFSVGLGGYEYAYVLDEYLPTMGWKALSTAGNIENVAPDSEFQIETKIYGQKVRLTVEGIRVLEHNLPRPLGGDQVGLFAWGPGPVEFKAPQVVASRPEAFVIMQFGEHYDALFKDVIKPIAHEMGLKAYRADDVYKPGIILQDIIRGIVEAEIVIAEITPSNPNVFYELGYAHALGKTTILLAERGKELPFDISSYRCIFYNNTIRGKNDVEKHLRKHLSSILRED